MPSRGARTASSPGPAGRTSRSPRRSRRCLSLLQTGMCLKSPPVPVAPVPTATLPPSSDRRDHLLAQLGAGVDDRCDHLAQDERTLRVAHEHEAAALVVVREVVLERVCDVVVCVRPVLGGRRLGAVERGQRDLAVDRRVDVAVLAVLRGLVQRDRVLLGADLQVGGRRRLVADRRIDVETVELVVRAGLEVVDPERVAGRAELLGRQVGHARVRAGAGAAEPHRSGLSARRRGKTQQRPEGDERDEGTVKVAHRRATVPLLVGPLRRPVSRRR